MYFLQSIYIYIISIPNNYIYIDAYLGILIADEIIYTCYEPNICSYFLFCEFLLYIKCLKKERSHVYIYIHINIAQLNIVTLSELLPAIIKLKH